MKIRTLRKYGIKLKGNPGECSPEQVKECHGYEAEHSCDSGCEKENE
ncbi:MAG TPA: hypothetical protein VHY08_20205 [Bacillota bacterium]|nr:hypothetical protein [Bacillota bacterium]